MTLTQVNHEQLGISSLQRKKEQTYDMNIFELFAGIDKSCSDPVAQWATIIHYRGNPLATNIE